MSFRLILMSEKEIQVGTVVALHFKDLYIYP